MSDLYDADIAAWSEDQARALRAAGQAGANLPIDWEHVAEEIESVGKGMARELASRIALILARLAKLEASPANDPRAGWRGTIREQRDEIERLLADAPSLRPTVPAVIGRELARARAMVAASLADNGESPRIDLGAVAYSEDQVLGTWLPDAPG